MDHHPPTLSNSRPGLRWRPDAGRETIKRETPVEAAIGLSFDGRPHTVLMATPADIEDLASGFTLTEGVAAFADILDIEVTQARQGHLVNVRLAHTDRRRVARPRTLEGRSSCGLCGVQRLADAVRPLPRVISRQRFASGAVQRALAALENHQPLGRATRATHAAGFADASGDLLQVREDVGRHNALDKLAGGLARNGIEPSHGFVLVTSRCSFEMVEKAARMGCPMIVAVSAPTDLAIEKAQEAGITLVALARADGHTIFSHPERLASELTAA